MKYRLLVMGICFVLFLGGCVGTTGTDMLTQLVKLPTGEIVTAATGRHGSAERAYISKMGAVKAGIELETVKEQKKDQVVIKIDSKDEMNSYALLKANNNMLTAVKILGSAVEAMSGRPSKYQVMYAAYQVPEGAFAEGIKAVGTAGRDLLGTTASTLYAGGWAFGKVMDGYDKASGDRTSINSDGGDINYVNKRSAVSVGDGNTDTAITGVNADTTSITEILEEPEEAEEAEEAEE